MSEKLTVSYWLLRAADAQSLADAMSNPEAKQMMLGIAQGYQRLAKHHATLAELNLPTESGEMAD